MKTKDLVTWGLIIAALYGIYSNSKDCGCDSSSGGGGGLLDSSSAGSGTCDPASYLITNKLQARWIRNLGAMQNTGGA
jgi:hypothetical protein